VAVAVWVLRVVFVLPAARARFGAVGWFLAALLAAQVYLGVEAWMIRFAQYTLPELVPITPLGAATRTAHALVGTGLLAASLGLAVRVAQRAGGTGRAGTITDGTGEGSRLVVGARPVVGTGSWGDA
jgi:hypothetical protein